MRKLLIVCEFHPSIRSSSEEFEECRGYLEESLRENKKLWRKWIKFSEVEKIPLICAFSCMSEEPAVVERWELIRKIVKERISKLDPARVKVYRDSITDSDLFKMEIGLGVDPGVFEDLLEFGAEFMPTEDEKLTETGEIEERDKYIAENINKTLKDGETGFLFIGLAHEVQKFLDPSIKYEIIFRKNDWPKSVTG